MIFPRRMTLREAARIVGGDGRNPSKVFGQTSKMPGRSYGLDAQACLRGSELAADPRSPCHPDNCYAKRNFYATWTPVVLNRQRHQAAIYRPEWAAAMVTLMRHYLRDETVFRWHDSGDIASVEHLAAICLVADQTYWLRHWLPTHEPYLVRDFLRLGGEVPANLVIRVSADRIGERPRLPDELAGFPTSTIHEDYGDPIMVSARRRDTVECRAHERDHQCGACRACWSPLVRNVSYPLSGSRADAARVRRSGLLRVVA